MKKTITVAEFMNDALYNKDTGYYANHEPIGRGGDFITAPEMSQVFGETVAIWCIDTWHKLQYESNINIVELGPGNGTMMQDVLRVVDKLATKPANAFLLEKSLKLRQRQQQKLGGRPIWLDELEQLPAQPTLFLANEFFDALPVDQYIYDDTGWKLRLVCIEEEQYKFVPGPKVSFDFLPEKAKLGDIFEHSEMQEEFANKISQHLEENGGAALIIDYGYSDGYGDTLQAMRNNRYIDVLTNPGQADITTHVNFSWLKELFSSKGLSTSDIIDQGRFLQQFGIDQRTQLLCKNATKLQIASLLSAAARLTAPQHMGQLFKVLIVWS